ncbi:MAG: hypothetical protein JRG67_07140 [Deltaproteobacteria bacterium]|nr:hypothetical protein [Deltaproteobacteria bacterium]MBW2378412.1 hypothetical protein [Deltaproteobacteria bacterium]MBW2549913.1 hypothetical protein [Deltaproteobacteria bacterium]
MALSTYRASAVMALLAVLTGCVDEQSSIEPVQVSSGPKSDEAPDPYEHTPSHFGVVPLHAGFSPDPRVVGGRAVGEVPAKSIHHKCKGWISETPDYLLDADTAFFQLHVLGRSRADVVLVVRKPDGAVLCNDNRSGTTDPMIHSDFPIGTTQIWIGVQEEGATADYRIGFSEVKTRSSSIPLPEQH